MELTKIQKDYKVMVWTIYASKAKPKQRTENQHIETEQIFGH